MQKYLLTSYTLHDLDRSIRMYRTLIEHFFNPRYSEHLPTDSNLHYYLTMYNKLRHEMRVKIMSKKKPVRASFVGFVNVELTTSDEKMIEKLLKTPDDSFELIDRVLLGEYDIKTTYNAEHSNYNVSISRWDAGHKNGGKVVSSFGASWYVAMLVCSYKVIHILGDEEWKLQDSKPKKAFG